ncbi:MAG: NEW3 domain-containing protein [Sphaerochaeta sp.]|uniref:COG1470 family protein n=1 Tax=Sphaerochaeta sp. TaxID=1972642 RepID=UPI003D0D8C3C
MKRNIRLVGLLVVFLVAFSPLFAAYEGLSVATSYPSLNVSSTDMITFDLKVKSYNLAPQRVDLSLSGLPNGWDYQFVGGGGLVNAVFAEPESTASVQLWVIPSKVSKEATYNFTINAKGEDGASFSLPLTVTMGKQLPQRLALSTELPTIKGDPSSPFSFQVTLRNNSASDTLIDLYADVPQGFSASFKEQYGSSNLNTLSLGAGLSRSIQVTVTPPEGVSEGTYPITVQAKSSGAQASVPVTLDVQGQAKLSLSGKDGLLSSSAVAGKEKVLDLELKNSGSATAKKVELSSYTPSNWTVSYNPSVVEEIPAGQTVVVKATVKPSTEALTGDYSLTLKANSANAGNVSTQYRITVQTSSLWGIVSIVIIAAAAVLLVFAVKKFGRR